MSKKISFADIAVNSVLIIFAAAAAVLLCVYLLRGKPGGENPAESVSPHVIDASDPEPSVTESETEQVTFTEETEVTTIGEAAPPPTDYDPAFFEDAFFIGDSLSVGLLNYEFLKPENVFAQAGITPSSVMTTKIDDVSVYEKVSGFAPEYICIMLGTNGIAYVEPDKMADDLGSFIDELKGICPDAKIAIASVPSVTRKHEEEKPEKLNDILEYNKRVKKLSEEKSIAFADVYTLLSDEEGYLGSDYAEHDGLHLKIHAYPVILAAIENAALEFYGVEFVPPETSVTSETSAAESAEPVNGTMPVSETADTVTVLESAETVSDTDTSASDTSASVTENGDADIEDIEVLE